MIAAVGPGKVDDAGRVAGLGAGGVVARPGLFGQLEGSARVAVVAAPAGSGKTVLLRSWIARAGLLGHAAWVPAGRDERDPQHFWLAVLGALRATAPGSALVRPLTAAPDMDGWAITERLLTDLAPLADWIWLVVDDVHELGPQVLAQLELLVMRAPPGLRFVLAARHDVRLGLHRLRLEGELAEIREPDLRFTVAEAAELFAAAGLELPAATVAVLHERTEGWAAGLRLAALSLAGHPDPERLAAEFSGTERTVAEYLLAEVLDRQPEPVQRLLLRTSILERVNGELAGLLTGDGGGERVLQDLEAANAFVVPLDASRTWFRYHQMFADLLQLELRRAAPGEVAALHGVAAGWFAGHGYPVEAVRHAQAAQDWDVAARLLVGYWPGLYLDGQAAAIHGLLAGFPAETRATDAELAAVAAGDELASGSLEDAERYLELARRLSDSVPKARRGQLELLLGVVSLLLAGQRGNLPGVAEAAQRLGAMAESADAAQPGLTEDLRALALISLGSTEFWAAGQDAGRHLETGLTLARQIGRPYLEFTGLVYKSLPEFYESFARSVERATAATELGRRHGWSDEPAFGVACLVLASALFWQGQLDESESWLRHAERTVRAETHPAPVCSIRAMRGLLELARGKYIDALAALQAAERLAQRLVMGQYFSPATRALVVLAQVGLGEIERARELLAGFSRQDREQVEVGIAIAAVRLAEDDQQAAHAALAPILDSPGLHWFRTMAHVQDAMILDNLGDQAGAERALERALDVAEPDGVVTPFLMYPAPGLLERHARHPTAHASLLAQIQNLLSGTQPSPPARPRPLLEAPSESELRVLRYLPTNLSMRQIAGELYVSHNTVRTHISHLYAKLGAHTRGEAVDRARALGLLAPSSLRGKAARPG